MRHREVRDMTMADEYFVGTCTHVGESAEADANAARRLEWFREMRGKGLRVKVALLDGEQAGFLYVMPIEISPWGPLGMDLLVIPCLCVKDDARGKGAGRLLIDAAVEETQRQAKKGLVTIAYGGDFWFMPASFFEEIGFERLKRRDVTKVGEKEYLSGETILWKVIDPTAEIPEFLSRNYRFEPVKGKVVIDLFWSPFCSTINVEAQRVREVAREFGDSVELREYRTDDRQVFHEYQIHRAIFINGREIGWGYEAPREGIREAIFREMDA